MDIQIIEQKQGYGCGIYSVANALQISSYVTPERLIKSEGGNNIRDLNIWLEEDGLGIFLAWLYLDLVSGEPKLPKDFMLSPAKEGYTLPLLLNVIRNKEGKLHLIAAHVTFDKKVRLIDSLEPEVKEVSWEDLITGTVYPSVFGVAAFVSVKTDQYITLSE